MVVRRSAVVVLLVLLIALAALVHPAPARAAGVGDALLTLADLPVGFVRSAERNSSEREPNPDAFCGNGIRDIARGAASESDEANYERSAFGPFIIHIVAVYDEAPVGITDRAWYAWNNCQWDDPTSTGINHWSMQEISFPTLGQESVAFRLDVKSDDGLLAVAGDLVIIRQGRAVSLLYHLQAGFGVAVVNSELTERLARVALAKLPIALR